MPVVFEFIDETLDQTQPLTPEMHLLERAQAPAAAWLIRAEQGSILQITTFYIVHRIVSLVWGKESPLYTTVLISLVAFWQHESQRAIGKERKIRN